MLSARNQLRGTVTHIHRGTAVGTVTIRLEGGEDIVSTITVESMDRLRLAEGSPAIAVIKASDVMVATDDQ